MAALPGASRPGRAAARRLRLDRLALPALVAVSVDAEVLGTLSAREMVDAGRLAASRVRAFLEKHKCASVDARRVLAAGLATAKETGRHAFVYLSAPW